MSTTVLLLLSGVMIGAGISLIWRDVHKRRRSAFVVERDVKKGDGGSQPEAEITIARPGPEKRLGEPPAMAGVEALSASATRADPAVVALDSRTVVQRWDRLQPVLAAALRQVNLVLAAAGVELGPPGPASRSINGAYGGNCRLQIGGVNVGSLRLQVTVHDQVHARVKAHGREAAAINASSSAPVENLDAARTSDLLSEVLKPAAAFALGAKGVGDAEQLASGAAWEAVDAVVVSALDAANGALAQAGSRFVAFGPPSWNSETRRHRMTVGIQVMRNEVARMHIERIGPEVEVAVGVPDARLVDLGRRRRIPVHGMTTHSLAELIAACAWPAIEHFRETQRAL